MTMTKFEIEVANTLRRLEIPAHMMGYKYISDAINLVKKKHDLIYSVTKELYPAVAQMHDTTPSRVERGIRHALGSSRANDETWEKVMGTKRIDFTNSEFIATLVETIRIKFASEDLALKSNNPKKDLPEREDSQEVMRL